MRRRLGFDCQLHADSLPDLGNQPRERRIRGDKIFRFNGRDKFLENIDFVFESVKLELGPLRADGPGDMPKSRNLWRN